jgi:endoglucanase
VVIEGHIDEIGLLITHIDEEGYLWFDQIGGWDDAVFVGQRVRIATTSGDIYGVIGRKAAHLIRKEDGDRPSRRAICGSTSAPGTAPTPGHGSRWATRR